MFSKSFLALLPILRVLIISSTLVTADIPPFYSSQAYQDAAYGNYTLQTYVTEPGFRVPVPNIVVAPQDGVSPSKYIFWTPVGFHEGMNSNGPMLLNATDMSLVYRANEYILPDTPGWAQETIGSTVQTCNGSDYLTWWAGKGLWGRKAGRYYVTNTDYELVYNISAIGLEYGDAHEFVLTPHCTAIVTSYQQRSYDLTVYNITDGWLLDSYFQEIDLATNELLFEWRASDHVKLEDSYLTTNISGQGKKEWDGWDYFHINSVEKDLHGNYLISSRHMHALYYIDGKTGETKWTLGGKSNEFTDLSEGKATDFAWQHHARWVSEDLSSISLFDNRNSKYVYAEDPVSRGIIIDLDVTAKSVSLAAEYRAPDDIISIREGSMQLLPDTPGNAMVGWGNEPGFTEYSANGTILFDVRFGPLLEDRGTADNYRALKVNWTASPTWAPKIAAGSNKTSLMLPLALANETLIPVINDTAYFSWNGATDLAKWITLTSSDSSQLNATSDIWKTVSKSGFESSIWIGSGARFVRAVAVNKNNIVVSATAVLDMKTGNVTDSAFNSTRFNEELIESKKSWGKLTLDTVQETWQKTSETVQETWKDPRSSGMFWPIIAGVLTTLIASYVAIMAVYVCVRYIRRQRRRGTYGRLLRRNRSDTLDSKRGSGIAINIVDYDEENEYKSSSEDYSLFVGDDDEEKRYNDYSSSESDGADHERDLGKS